MRLALATVVAAALGAAACSNNGHSPAPIHRQAGHDAFAHPQPYRVTNVDRTRQVVELRSWPGNDPSLPSTVTIPFSQWTAESSQPGLPLTNDTFLLKFQGNSATVERIAPGPPGKQP